MGGQVVEEMRQITGLERRVLSENMLPTQHSLLSTQP